MRETEYLTVNRACTPDEAQSRQSQRDMALSPSKSVRVEPTESVGADGKKQKGRVSRKVNNPEAAETVLECMKAIIEDDEGMMKSWICADVRLIKMARQESFNQELARNEPGRYFANPFTDFDTFVVVRGNNGWCGDSVNVYASPLTDTSDSSAAGAEGSVMPSSSACGKVLTSLKKGDLVTVFNKSQYYGLDYEVYDRRGRAFVETVVGLVRGWIVRKYSPAHDQALASFGGLGIMEANMAQQVDTIEYLRYVGAN